MSTTINNDITETKEQEMQDVTTESEKDDFEFLGEKTVSSQLSGQNKIEMINQETMTDIKIFRRSRLHASTSTDGLAETALNNYCFVDFENYILSIRQKKPETGDTNLDVIVHQGDTEEETESEDEFVDKSDEDSWLYSPHFELWTKEWLEMESIGIMSKNVEVDCFEEEVNDVFSFAKLQPVYSLLEYPQQVINFSKTKHKATKSKKYKKGNYKVKEEEVEFIGEKSRRIEEEELNFILLSWFYGENASEKEETKKSKEDLLKCTGSSSSHVSSVVDLEKTREYGLRETTKVSEEDIEKEIAVEEEESDISILSDEILKESSTSSSACSLPESNEELVNLYYECIYAIRELQVQEKRSQKLEVAPDVHDEEDDFEYTDVEDEEIDKIIKEGGVDDDDDDDDKDDDYDDDEGVDDDDDDDDDDDEDNDEFTLEELIDDSEQSEVKEEGDAQKVQQDEGKGKKSISDNREGVHESNEFNTQVEDEEEEEDEDEDEDEDEEEEEEEEADLDEEKGGSFVDNDKQIVEEEKLGEGRGKDDKVEKKASINKKGDKKEGVKKKEDGKKKEDDGKIKRTHPDLISGNEELNKEDNFDLKARSVTGAKMGNVKGDLKNSIIYNEDEDEIENEEELDENVETLDEQEISKSEDEIFGKGSYGSFEFERLSIRSSLQSDYDVFVGQYDSAEILKEEDDIENDDRKSTEGKTEERESKKDAGGESLIMMDVHEEVKVEGGRKGSDEEEVLDEGEKEDSSSYESDENDDEEEDEFDDYGQIELLKKSDIPFQPEDFTAMANYDLEDDDDSENEIYEDENDDDYDIIEGLEDEDNEDEKSEDEFSKEKSYGDEADQERSHREIVDETVGHQVDESETDITDITPKKKKQFQRVESDVDDDDDDEDDYNDDDDTTDDDGSDDYNVEDGDDDDDYYTDFDEEDDSSDDDNDSESRWYKTKLNVMIETCSTGGSDESGAENKKEKKIIGTQSDTDDSENFRDKIEEKNKKDDKYKKKMEDPSRTRKIKTKNLGGVGVSDAEIFDDAINKTDNAYLSAYSSYLQRALRSQEVKENAINLFTQNICDAETLAFDEYFKSRKRENSLIGEHFALRNLLSSEDRSNVIIVPRELRKKKLFLQRYHKFKYFKEVKHEDIFDVEDFDNDWQSPEFGLSEFVVILEEAKEQEENRPPIPLHDILAGEVDKTNLLGNDYEVTNVNDNVKEIENKVYNSPSGLSFLSYDIQHTMSMAKNNSLTACISPSMWELSQISDVEYSSLEIFLKNVAYIVYMYNDKPMEKEDVIIECYKEEKFKSGKIYLKSEESDNNGNEEQEQTIVLPVKIELKTVDKEFFFQFLELLRSLTLNELKEFDLLDIYEHFKHVIISIPEFKEETLKTAKKKPKHPHYMYRSKKYFKQIEEKMMTLIQRYCVPKETSSKALHFSDKVKVESTENLRAFSSATYNRYSELNLMSIIPGEVFIGHTSKSYRDAQIQVEYVKPRADFALLGKVNSADVSVQTSDLITTLLSDPNSLSSVDLDLSDEEEDIYWNKLYDALVGNVQIAAEIIDFVLEHSASIELPLKIKKKEKCSSDENKDSLVIILKNPEEESDRESNVLGMDESLVEQESEECLTKKCSGIRLKRSRAFTSHRNIDMQLSKSDVFIPPSIALKNLRSFLNAVTELLYTPMSFKGFRPWPLPFSRPKTFFRKDKTLKDKSLLIYPDGKPRSSLHKVHSETYKCENQRNSLHVSLSFSFSKDETDESYSHCFSTSTLTESDIDELTDKGLRVISTVMNEGNVIFHPVPESSKVSDKSIKSKKGKVKYIMKPYLSFRKVHKIVDKKSLPPRPWVVESSKGNWIWVEEYLKYDQLKEFNDLFGSVGEKGIATADELSIIKFPKTPFMKGKLYMYLFHPRQQKYMKYLQQFQKKEFLSNLRMRDVLWEKLIEEDPSCEPYRGYGSPLRVPSKSEMKLPKFSVLIHNSKKVSSMKFEPDIRIPAFYQQPSDMWEENLFPSCIERLKAVLDDTVICPYKKIDKELKDVLLPTKKVKRRKGRSFPSGSATVTSSSILKPFYDTDENSVKNDRVLKSEEPTKMKEEAKTEGKKLSVTVVDKKQVESPLSALIKDISISGYQKEEDSKENAAGDQNGSIVKSVKAFWWNVLRLNEDIVHDYEEEIDGINVVKSIEAEHLVYKEVEREIELEVDEEHSDGKKDVNEQIKVKSNELQDHENLEEQIKEKLDIENKHEVEAGKRKKKKKDMKIKKKEYVDDLEEFIDVDVEDQLENLRYLFFQEKVKFALPVFQPNDRSVYFDILRQNLLKLIYESRIEAGYKWWINRYGEDVEVDEADCEKHPYNFDYDPSFLNIKSIKDLNLEESDSSSSEENEAEELFVCLLMKKRSRENFLRRKSVYSEDEYYKFIRTTIKPIQEACKRKELSFIWKKFYITGRESVDSGVEFIKKLKGVGNQIEIEYISEQESDVDILPKSEMSEVIKKEPGEDEIQESDKVKQQFNSKVVTPQAELKKMSRILTGITVDEKQGTQLLRVVKMLIPSEETTEAMHDDIAGEPLTLTKEIDNHDVQDVSSNEKYEEAMVKVTDVSQVKILNLIKKMEAILNEMKEKKNFKVQQRKKDEEILVLEELKFRDIGVGQERVYNDEELVNLDQAVKEPCKKISKSGKSEKLPKDQEIKPKEIDIISKKYRIFEVGSNDEDLEIKSSSESEEEPDPVLDNVVNLKLKGSEFSYGSQEFLPYVRPAVPLEKTHQKFMATGTLFYDGSRVYESETDESYCEKIKDENTLTVLHSFLHEGCYVKRGITPACKTICRKKHAEIALPESYKKLLESDSVCTKKTYNEEETIDEIKGFYFTMLAEDEEDDDEGDEDLKVFVTAIKRRLKEVQEECCHKDAHTGTKSIVFYPEFVYNATVDQEETVTPELEEKQGRVSSTEEFNYVLEDNVLKKLSKKLENLKEIINKKNELRKDVETQEEEITFEKEIEINSVSSDEGTTIEDPNENVKISENTVAKLNELSQLEVEKLNEIYWIFINCKTVSEAIKKQVKVVSVAIQTEIDEEYAHGMHYCDVRFNHLMEQLEDELQYKLSDTDEEVGEKEKSQQNIFMKGDTKESSDMKAELKTDYGPTYDKNGNSDYCIYEQCSVSSKKDKTDSIENWDEVKSEEDKMDKEMSEKEDHKKEKVMKLDSDFKDEKDDDSIERDMKNVLRKKEHKYKTERMERKAYVREVQLHKREMKQILKANAGPGKCRHLKTVMKRTLKSCIKLGTCLAPSYASRRRFREIKRIMFGLPLSSESSLLCINVSSETILKKLQDKKLISQSLQFFSLKRTKGDSHLSFPSHDYMLSQFEQSGVNDQKLLAEFPLTPSSSYSSSSSTLVSEKQVELINFNPESFLIEYLKTDAEILTWRKTEPLLSDYKSVVYELDSKKSSEIQKSIMQRLISKHEEEILNINYNTCSSSVKSYLDKLLEEKVISDFKNNSSSISSSIKKVFDQELRSLIKLSEFKKHQILSEEFPLKRKPAVLVTPISSDIDRIMHYMLEECEFPVLPPAHQASLITDQERRHPLMKFDNFKMNFSAVRNYLAEVCLISKINLWNKHPEFCYGPTLMHSTDYYAEIFKKKIHPPSTLSVDTIKGIYKKLPAKIGKKYPELIKQCIIEAKEIFDDVMYRKSLFGYIKVLHSKNTVPFFVPQKPNFSGKLVKRVDYLLLQEYMNKQLLIYHKFPLSVQKTLGKTLNKVLVDYRKYRKMKEIWNAKDLFEIIEGEVKKADNIITKTWYGRILELLSKRNVFGSIDTDKLGRLLQCVCVIISSKISIAVAKNMEDFVKTLSDPKLTPQIEFEAMFKQVPEHDGIQDTAHHYILHPERKEFFAKCHGILEEIYNIGQQLPTPETILKRDYPEVARPIVGYGKQIYIAVRQDTSIHRKCHGLLEQTLKKYYDDVLKYVSLLEYKFAHVTFMEHSEELEEFIKVHSDSYEDLMKKLEYYSFKGREINRMYSYVNFTLGRLYQLDGSDVILHYLEEHILVVLIALREIFFTDEERFENELKEITRRALTIPQTTEELVELGKYMLFAQTRFLPQQRKEIIRFFTYHWRMIGNVSVSKKLNGLVPKIIKNVLKMDSVFEKYASLYETTKFEFEDTLREFINKTREEVHHIKPELDRLNRLCHFRKIVEYNEFIKSFIPKIEKIQQDVDWIHREQNLFGNIPSTFPELDELKDAIEPLAKLIFTAYNWYVKKTFILHGQWDLLFIKDVEHWGDFFLKEFIQFHKQFKLKCRAYEKNNFPLNIFKGSTDEVDNLEKLPAPLRLINETTQHIKNFEPYINLVRILRNPNLQERHWIEMSQLVGINLTPNAGSTIARYMSIKKLRSQIDKLELISVAADKELQLEQNLRKMYDEWKNVLFNVCSFKETDLLIITQVDDIQSLLDDHIAKTLSMRGSPFVKPIEHEVKAWYDKLVRFNKTLNVWGKVQSEWLHLYPIFSSEFIRLQLPNEAKSFQDVDTKYKYVMNLLLKDRTAIITGPAPNLLELLEHCMAVIEKINVGVSRYLEKKRLVFPRFFFLSNDELLEILSHSTEPLKVQPHLIKCFEGIHKLGFSHSLMIYGMFSSEGEHVKFRKSISTEKTKGAIEKWLIQVEKQMIASLKHVTKKCIKNLYFNEKTVWVTLWPGQILLCVNQALWTASVQTALRQNTLSTSDTMLKKVNKSLAGIVQLLGENLTKNQRISLEALIVLEVHNKDVVADLYNHGITTDLDFKWLSQLRYYWEDGGMVVRICNVSFNYKYEYLGNSARLVITPLTDRCYRTLMGAYNLHLNGAPEGPAGTGKTETVKDLAKALAVQCIVFNCSEGLDYIAMGKFFKGLAACGAWACFDEFNRIGVEVLSAITQQMLKILHAVCHRLKFFVFEGTRLRLCPTCFVCITMNPGYAGRSELPDNLKLLFRTVAMMVPDYALIAEIVLYANGFLCARKLAIKIVTAYRLCSEQLSSQSHYDYGMRAVKAVLSAAGNLKLKYPKVDEDNVILRSIIDVNLPRFLSQDVPLFEGIISDIFPNMSPFSRDYTNFNNAVREICIQRGLQASENFMIKISQTYEMMIVRHGFMLVGDPLSGKSSILKVLADSLTLMYERNQGGSKVIYTVLNPKAVSMKELYGHFDEVSHEWHDGIAAEAFRKFGMVRTPERKWIIFDGPVDAAWIENMNTVLDDSKKLCLNSGEVIKMNPKMSMIFEVMDLREASPATVSRCGMIYLESSALGWRCIVDSWLEAWPKKRFPEFIENAVFLDRLLENYKTYYITVYEWLIPPALEFIRIHCNYVVSVGPSHRFLQALNMTDMVLTAAIVENLQLKRHDNISEYFKAWRDAAVIHGLMQGLAGAMDMESRQKFDEFFRTLLNGGYKEHPPPEFMKMLNLPKPERLMDDSFYRFRQSGFWTHWEDVISNKYMNLEPEEDIRQMLIPSIESLKYQYITEEYVKAGKPLLLVGATGTGKTFYLENYMNNKLDFSQYIPCSLALTVNITAAKTQETVINKLSKRGRGCYGPPKGKKAILFIDDLNLPAKDMYGAQPTMELLRMFFDQGFWYDLGDMSELYLEDVIVLSAMGLPGGNRQHICPRTLRHFAIYNICPFSDKSMLRIFGMLLQLGYKKNGFFSDIVPLLRLMITATIQLYHRCRKKLRPTPNKAHYLFSLRDIARCTNGLLLFTKESYFGDKKEFTRLWIHEMLRVFYDRLVNVKDRRCFLKIIKEIVEKFFSDQLEEVFLGFEDQDKGEKSAAAPSKSSISSKNTKPKLTKVTVNFLRKVIYTLPFDREDDDIVTYLPVTSVQNCYQSTVKLLEEYNSLNRNAQLNIILFRYALEHLIRLVRVLNLPGDNSFSIGVSGSGRQSLTALAAIICKNKLIHPECSKDYGRSEWHKDLKNALMEGGARKRNVTLLISEKAWNKSSFLQDIDVLLNSGEVPNIFAVEEIQEILEIIRLGTERSKGVSDSDPVSMLTKFKINCKKNIHVVICISPFGSFRESIRLYPSFVNCCTIDWFDEWPPDALEKIATVFLHDMKMSEEMKENVLDVCQYIHVTGREMAEYFYKKTGRRTYITNFSYLNLLRQLKVLSNQRMSDLNEARMRYLNGLRSLLFAAEQISAMKETLLLLHPQATQAAEEAALLALDVKREATQVQLATEMVLEEQRLAEAKAEEARLMKLECELDLSQLIPIFTEALEALDTLKPKDMTILKSMKNPPGIVKLVMEAVCIMLDVKPDRAVDPVTARKILDFWGPSMKIVTDINFLKHLKEYDKDNIPARIIDIIRKHYIAHKEFDPALVRKASRAAEGLCKWVIAMEKYDRVIKIVTPKKLRIQEADEFVQMTLKAVEEKKRYVKSYEEALNELRKRFEALEARRHEMERSVAQCITKADRADKIIAGLSSERERWTKSAAMCKLKYHNVIGDTLLSCAFMTYLGPYNKSFRKAIIAHWKKRVNIKKIPCDKNYGLVKIIGDEVLIQKWFTGNLPQDDFSIENAVLGINSMRWPLFIDPESQANNWIRSYYSTKNLEIVKVSRTKPYMSKMRAALVSAIPDGSPVLLENVEEELDTALDPILMKQTFFRSGFTYITYEDSTFKYHPEFKFFMTTKLRNPHFLPDVVNKVTVINFLLTKEAMEDQLQTSAVFYTRPTLEDKRTTMVSDKAMNMEYIKKLENRILEAMHKAKSKILDDTRVLKILNETKTLAVQIKEKQVLCRQIEIELASLRRHFTQLAVFSRILYECMSTLQSVDYMYRYSLPIFQRIYSLVVRGVVRENPYISWRSLQKKCIEEFMVAIFNFVCRGIFQKHRLLYSFLICIKVMMNSQITDQSQLMFFMTGPREMEEVITKPKQQWITKKAWEEICYLKKFKAFKDLPNHLTKHTRQWKNFYLAENPFKEPLPPSFQKKCTLFEKLMLVRAVRPDKLVLAVKKMVSCCLSSEFVDAKPISLLNCFNEYSKKSSPFLFILSPGVDPMISVRSLVNKVNKLEKLKVVSLGQGQLSLVEKYLTEAREAGSWVCLQNLHLAASWMDKLEEWFETILWECDFRFRLVLTSYPCEIIPERILQRCVKVAEEVPTGIRFNMIRTFHSAPITNPQFYHSCPNKNVEFSRLLFGLSLFHAVVVERKKYGPLGWNIPYGFNESDFNISACQIQAYINQYHELPLNAISYMTGECNYGGRVTDEWDRRTLMSIIKQFINPYIVKGNHYHVFEDDLASFIELPTKKNSFEDYLEIISEIPDKYPTEILGFHKNADIMRDLTGTNEFLGNLLDIQTKGGKKKQDSELLTILEDILKKLMKPFSIEKVVKKYPHKYEESMNIVLVQEMQRFNHLTKTIKTSLKELKSAIFGFTILSPELEAVGHSLIINRIPVAWRSASYPTLKSLSSYISDLIERLTFFHGWFKIGHPVSYWMSGFFFQQGFITAAMQNYARKRSIPIDLLGFDFKILNNPKSLKYPERGVYVHGLFIQGARWNSEIHRLAEQLANAFSEPMPTIWLIPMEKKQIEVGDRYVCPLYKTSERKGVLSTTGHSTNFVIAMLLDCSKTPDHWIRRGCALLCQLD